MPTSPSWDANPSVATRAVLPVVLKKLTAELCCRDHVGVYWVQHRVVLTVELWSQDYNTPAAAVRCEPKVNSLWEGQAARGFWPALFLGIRLPSSLG